MKKFYISDALKILFFDFFFFAILQHTLSLVLYNDLIMFFNKTDCNEEQSAIIICIITVLKDWW